MHTVYYTAIWTWTSHAQGRRIWIFTRFFNDYASSGFKLNFTFLRFPLSQRSISLQNDIGSCVAAMDRTVRCALYTLLLHAGLKSEYFYYNCRKINYRGFSVRSIFPSNQILIIFTSHKLNWLGTFIVFVFWTHWIILFPIYYR